MEFLLVKFREHRQVVVDDHYLGATNEVIEVEAGKHSISLAAPYDYLPFERQVLLVDSTVFAPIEIEFS
ncbi:MAG: PEGA domain-containing protein [Gammaproteobacteria bacterium]